ncbi:alpha/beta hydrolase [Streptomyces sp. NPDC048845]
MSAWPDAAVTAVRDDAPDRRSARLRLPAPTGPYAVGHHTLHLTDTDRRDPWVPESGPRELMVTVHHPARPGSGGAPAPYMTAEEARLLLEANDLADSVPAQSLAGTRTHARPGARPAPGQHPLVVLSPGFSLNRATLTTLAEDLASRGYVVATVDHAYESFGTAFPGGRTLTCVACEKAEQTGYDAVARGRAEDLSFVLDRLTGHRSPWPHARMIDRRRIGMAGHSIGGNSTASTMAADDRVRAGVNMDGTFFDPVPATGLDGRPFMLLGTAASHGPDTGDESWPRDWARLDGWKRWLTVTGSGHMTFTDFPVFGDQLGITDPEAPLSGERSQQITRDYVAAFFDQHLRGVPQPLLDGPTPENPEVGFHRP